MSRKEIWKDIKGWEGYYQVSSKGRIKSLARLVYRSSDIHGIPQPERILKLHLQNSGYLFICLQKDGYKKWYTIHRLVAIHFIPNPDNKPQVNHIKSVKTDNNVENLEWVNNRENSTHHALKNRSSRYVGVRLTKEKSWRATIKIKGKAIALGCYKTEEEAGIAYQKALVKYNQTNSYAV